jgi:hypothetical protein
MARGAKRRNDETERRKSDEDRKDSKIPVRVTAEQKDKINAAAERAGLDASALLRLLGLREYESPSLVQPQPGRVKK